jgi:hypothetical protein
LIVYLLPVHTFYLPKAINRRASGAYLIGPEALGRNWLYQKLYSGANAYMAESLFFGAELLYIDAPKIPLLWSKYFDHIGE